MYAIGVRHSDTDGVHRSSFPTAAPQPAAVMSAVDACYRKGHGGFTGDRCWFGLNAIARNYSDTRDNVISWNETSFEIFRSNPVSPTSFCQTPCFILPTIPHRSSALTR